MILTQPIDRLFLLIFYIYVILFISILLLFNKNDSYSSQILRLIGCGFIRYEYPNTKVRERHMYLINGQISCKITND